MGLGSRDPGVQWHAEPFCRDREWIYRPTGGAIQRQAEPNASSAPSYSGKDAAGPWPDPLGLPLPQGPRLKVALAAESPSSHRQRPNGCGWSQPQACWLEGDGRAQPEAQGPRVGGVSGGGAETAAVPTHLCTHLTGQTLGTGAHLLGLSIVPPQRRTATARGVPPAACWHAQVLWVYSSGGRGAGDKAQRDSLDWALCLEAGRHLRRCPPGTAAAQGQCLPRTPRTPCPMGGSRCDLLESSTQSDEGHYCLPRGDAGPTSFHPDQNFHSSWQ